MNATPLIVGLLAQTPPRDTGPDFGKASPLGLLIVVLLLIGIFLLVRSMNRHLRKVPETFDTDEAEDTADTENADGTDGNPEDSDAASDPDRPIDKDES